MAIDPSIALGVKQLETPNPLDMALKAGNLQAIQQQISASQTNQRSVEAQIPGQQANSELLQRQAAFKKWMTSNAGEYTDKGGSDTAPREFNHDKFVSMASKAGFIQEAQAVAASDLSNSAAKIKNAEDVDAFAKKARGYTAQLVANAPEDQRAGLQDQYRSYVDGLLPGGKIGELIGPYDAKTSTATRAATMTPLEQANLGVSQGNLAVSQGSLANAVESTTQGGVGSNTGKAARDPNSPQSVAARAFATQAGLPVTGGMSAADVANLPGYADAVKATVVPGGTKAAAVGGAVEATQKAQAYDALATPLNNLKAKGLLKPGTTIQAFIEQNVSRLGNDPDFRALQAGASSLPDLNIKTNDVNGMLAQIKQQSTTLKGQAATAGKVAGSTTFNQTPGAVAPAPAPAPAAPEARVNVMNRATGQVGTIPASRLKDYIANGFVQVGK